MGKGVRVGVGGLRRVGGCGRGRGGRVSVAPEPEYPTPASP